MSSKPRIRDVAQRAGVSVGTVSNVLNGVATVRSDNLERVRKAMAELDFVPNSNARQLRRGHGAGIGLITLGFRNPHASELAEFVERAAEKVGSTILLGSSGQAPERARRYLDLFEEARVRGVIVSPLRGIVPHLRELQSRGTPVVLFYDTKDLDDFCTVAMDGLAAGRLAAEHLLEIGRRHLLVIGGPVDQVAERLHGASLAVETAGSATLGFISTADQTVSEGRAVGRRIAALPPAERPDGIFAVNDLIGLGVLQELVLAGVAVPDEVALIGCDDIDFAQTAIIPMTSLAQPREAIAQDAIELLLIEERERGEHRHQQRLRSPELRVRASTRG